MIRSLNLKPTKGYFFTQIMEKIKKVLKLQTLIKNNISLKRYLKLIVIFIAFIFNLENARYDAVYAETSSLRIPINTKYTRFLETARHAEIGSIFLDNGFISINALRNVINQAVEGDLIGILKPVIIGSAIYLADENGFVDLALISDIDIGFQEAGDTRISRERKIFAENLHSKFKNILGQDNVGEIRKGSLDWEFDMDMDAFYEFDIKDSSGNSITITVTTMVNNTDMANDIVYRGMQIILTQGPIDNFGRFPGYEKAIKRYMLLLYYLGDGEEFNNYKRQYSQIVHSSLAPQERESRLMELFKSIEEIVKMRKNDYLARTAPGVAEISGLIDKVSQSLSDQSRESL